MQQTDETAMRQMHDARATRPMAQCLKSPHPPTAVTVTGNKPMFVRAVWRSKRLVDLKQTLRVMDVPSPKDADLLGISGPDFAKMTRSLFDR
jgi:hypothetical protein